MPDTMLCLLCRMGGDVAVELDLPTAWHGRLMVMAWGVLAPLAVLLARYCKVMPAQKWPAELDNPFWWHGHRWLNYLAVVLTLLAVFLVHGALRHPDPWRELHALAGWSMLSLALLQVLGAHLRGSKGGPTAPRLDAGGQVLDLHGDHFDMTLRRRCFEYAHKSLGHLCWMLAWATLLLGLNLAHAPYWMALVLLLWWCALLASAWQLQRQGRCLDTYQAIWGNAPELPGNQRPPIGWGVRRLPAAQHPRNHTPWEPTNMDILDPRLAKVLGDARLEKLCTGASWGEGPVWMHEDQSVLWSDIPNNRILRWSARDGMRVWREQAEFTNGHWRDLNGDLLHCSHGMRAIMRTPCTAGGVQAQTPAQIVVDTYDGKRLNSPNDLVVRADGTLWFTDPPYGILSDREGHQAPREQAANHVFCFDPRTHVLHAATDAVDEPNGLAFSPDESILYVSDTSAALRPPGQGQRCIWAFDVDHMRLHRKRLFAQLPEGLPDGFRVDRQGWVYSSSEDAIRIYDAHGTLLGRIPVPERVGNLTFGGAQRNELFIAASTSLYRIRLNTRGIQAP
jgi:gluconolactonase